MLLPCKRNGKYGYQNLSGEIVVEPIYDYVSVFSSGYGAASVWNAERQSSVSYFLDETGDITRNFGELEYCSEAHEGFVTYGKNDHYGFYSLNKRQRDIPHVFDFANHFFNGLAVVRTSGRYGVINQDGDWVIPPQYEEIRSFKYSPLMTVAKYAGAWWLINTANERVAQFHCSDLGYINDGFVPFEASESLLWGVMNLEGRISVPPNYYATTEAIREKTLSVEHETTGLWGMIDLRGEWIISPQYNYVGMLVDGMAPAYSGGRRDLNRCLLDGRYGYLNQNGELIIEHLFDDSTDFLNGIAEVEMVNFVDREINEYDSYRGYYIKRDEKIMAVWESPDAEEFYRTRIGDTKSFA